MGLATLCDQAESVMDATRQLLVFAISGQRYALHLSAVDRIVHAVEVTRLPQAPSIVDGVINVQGQIMPVVNINRRFGLPEREMRLTDRLIIARTSRRPVALRVESVSGVVACPEETVIRPESVLPGMALLQGLLKLDDGLVLIHDLDSFLSLDEALALDAAMSRPEGLQQGTAG